MADPERLDTLLNASAAKFPQRTAVQDPGRGELSYLDLNRLADVTAATLRENGIREGDRIGLLLPKSLASVACLYAILKSGAAYIPVDVTAPLSRGAYIFKDCSIRALFVDSKLAGALLDEWGPLPGLQRRRVEPASRYGVAVELLILPPCPEPEFSVPDIAYILYTSGSTGVPKGVVHTHASAMGFVRWCASEFDLDERDRFSSHAPFHFDLSIFDLYVACLCGAALVLVDESTSKQPVALAELIAASGISVWYSTPSILRMLVEFGRLEKQDWSALRLVLFAGETYPVKHYRQLRAHWRTPTYYNLYGPTETNVCTYYRVPDNVAESDFDYFPIGAACSGDRLMVVHGDGERVAAGEPGELLVSGASVMSGYWNLAEKNEQAFVVLDDRRWYRTGDIVRELAGGDLHYLSRRDRMIKRRGYRVELGEIEAALYRSPQIVEAAALALTDGDGNVIVKAFVTPATGTSVGIIALKTFCARNLPFYMIPDQFAVLAELPKTSTDKIDYRALKEL
ncbi:MAG: amino acid adenylation domain-containing protein [Halioglobus sp.]|nr:amino acid adenylation domain-containing protein [Halioglobus sp.]